MGARKIAIFDTDVFRRGAISRQIFECGLHCEPYEDLAEFAAHLTAIDLVIAFDDTGTVSEIHEALSNAHNWVPVVLYGIEPSARRVVDAMHQGAIDYLEWPPRFEDISFRLERLLGEHGSYAAMLSMSFKSRRVTEGLSLRERQILRLLKGGQSNKEMGRTLGISHRTVEIHRSNMLSKLQVSSSAEAVGLAVYAELSDAMPETLSDITGSTKP